MPLKQRPKPPNLKRSLKMQRQMRPHKPHYKTNFNKSVLTTPKTVRPKSPVDYGPAVQQAKQNKALGKQSSVCLTYY